MIRYFFFFTLLFFNTACNKEPQPSVYKESKIFYLNSIHWGEEELHELSKKMVQKILSSKDIELSNAKEYTFEKIRNDTHDQIDTQTLQSKITSSLIKTTKFKFIEKDKNEQSYIFKGKLSSIFKKSKDTKDMFFSFNLTLLKPKTLEVIWSDDIEIRKIYKRPLFSW